jgi:hypothetical protein
MKGQFAIASDAVGVDAVAPSSGPAGQQATEQRQRFRRELAEISPEARAEADQWRAGDAPSQALEWAVKSLAKAGTLSISRRWTYYPASGLSP